MEPTARSAPTRRMAHPRLIRAAAIMQSLYALIEATDCIVAVFMALGLLGNFYPKIWNFGRHSFDRLL